VDVYLHKNCVMKIIHGRCIMSIKIEMSKGMENGGAIEVVGAVCEPRAETSCANVNQEPRTLCLKIRERPYSRLTLEHDRNSKLIIGRVMFV
jgi:hypothetical protein